MEFTSYVNFIFEAFFIAKYFLILYDWKSKKKLNYYMVAWYHFEFYYYMVNIFYNLRISS